MSSLCDWSSGVCSSDLSMVQSATWVPSTCLTTWIVAILVVLVNVQVHVSQIGRASCRARAEIVGLVGLGEVNDTAPAVKPVCWTSARCTDEPAASTSRNPKSLVSHATVGIDADRAVIGVAGALASMVQSATWVPSTCLTTWIVAVLVVLVNVQVHVS